VFKRYRGCLFVLLIAVLALAGCGPKAPPPDEVLPVLEHVRAGYNAEDMELFCADFGEVMFSGGFTRETYLQTVQQVKAQLGAWQSEAYLGAQDNEYTWRVTFAQAKAKLLLVMDADWRVIGLWFR
jgi:predicted small lipoprotein YifL